MSSTWCQSCMHRQFKQYCPTNQSTSRIYNYSIPRLCTFIPVCRHDNSSMHMSKCCSINSAMSGRFGRRCKCVSNVNSSSCTDLTEVAFWHTSPQLRRPSLQPCAGLSRLCGHPDKFDFEKKKFARKLPRRRLRLIVRKANAKSIEMWNCTKDIGESESEWPWRVYRPPGPGGTPPPGPCRTLRRRGGASGLPWSFRLECKVVSIFFYTQRTD